MFDSWVHHVAVLMLACISNGLPSQRDDVAQRQLIAHAAGLIAERSNAPQPALDLKLRQRTTRNHLALAMVERASLGLLG